MPKMRDTQVGETFQSPPDLTVRTVTEIVLPTHESHAELQGKMKIVFADGGHLLFDPEADYPRMDGNESDLWGCCRHLRDLWEKADTAPQTVPEGFPQELAILYWRLHAAIIRQYPPATTPPTV
jgi:hypothetical protein